MSVRRALRGLRVPLARLVLPEQPAHRVMQVQPARPVRREMLVLQERLAPRVRQGRSVLLDQRAQSVPQVRPEPLDRWALPVRLDLLPDTASPIPPRRLIPIRALASTAKITARSDP